MSQIHRSDIVNILYRVSLFLNQILLVYKRSIYTPIKKKKKKKKKSAILFLLN